MKRRTLTRKKSKSMFARGADRRHPANAPRMTPRGGRKLT